MLRVLISVGALQFAAMFVLMLRTKGLALLLGPEQFGLMAALDRLVAVFAQTASLSLPFAALRYLSPLWHERRDQYHELLRRMKNVLLLLVGVALTAGVALTWWSPTMLGTEVAGDRVLATLALAGLPVVALVPFLQNTVASSFAHNRAMLFLLLHAVVFAAASLSGVALWGLRGMYGVYAVLGSALVFVVLWRVQRRARRNAERSRPVPIAPARPEPASAGAAGGAPAVSFGTGIVGYLPPRVWRFCLLLLPSAFLAPAVAYSVFYQVLSTQGNQAAGYMQAAVGLSLAVRSVLGAASQVFLTPLVNRAGAFEDRLQRATEFQKTLFLFVGGVVPPLVLFSGLAIRILYSAEFTPGASFVALFVTVEVLALAVGAYQAVLIAMEHIVFYVTQNALAQVAMYGVAVLTIPALGITGAALAGLAAQMVLLVGTLSYLGWRYRVEVPRRLAALSLYVFVVLAASGLLASALPGLSWGTVAWKLAFWIGATGILALFLSRQDWRDLGRFLRRGDGHGPGDSAGSEESGDGPA